MTNILILPNAMKGSLTAAEAIAAMEAGVRDACPDCTIVSKPIADGGDGFADIIGGENGTETVSVEVHDPLGRTVEANFSYNASDSTAMIDVASACGLAYLKESEYDPLVTSSYGVGELISQVLDLNIKRLIIGIGGTATNDAGMGMAAALGARFLDMAGEEIKVPAGADLGRISRVDMSDFDPRLADVTVEALCDVDNPLLGEKGAAHVYAPQKGASKEVVERLETGMQHFVTLLSLDLGFKQAHVEGMGAGGGIAAGMAAFLNASLRKGIDMVIEQLNIEEDLAAADLVITTEGRLDSQTLLHGKAPAGIAVQARHKNVPCFAIAGEIEITEESNLQDVFTAVFSLCPGPVSRELAMQEASSYLEHITRQVVQCFLAGKNHQKQSGNTQ
jgi:glycerate kinase